MAQPGQNQVSTEQLQMGRFAMGRNKNGKKENGAGEIEEIVLWGSVHVSGKSE